LVTTHLQQVRYLLNVYTIYKSGNYVRNFRFINQFINRAMTEGSRSPKTMSADAPAIVLWNERSLTRSIGSLH